MTVRWPDSRVWSAYRELEAGQRPVLPEEVDRLKFMGPEERLKEAAALVRLERGALQAEGFEGSEKKQLAVRLESQRQRLINRAAVGGIAATVFSTIFFWAVLVFGQGIVIDWLVLSLLFGVAHMLGVRFALMKD